MQDMHREQSNQKRVLFVGASHAETASPHKMGLEDHGSYDRIVAVDGGAYWCWKYHFIPHVFVGDCDTLAPKTLRWLEKVGSAKQILSPHKDMTDFAFALKQCLPKTKSKWGLPISDSSITQTKTETQVELVGFLGAKLDHQLGVLGVLKNVTPHYPNCQFLLRGTSQDAWFLSSPGRRELKLARAGRMLDDAFSVIPLTQSIISIEGCEWNLKKKVMSPLSDLGISNKIKSADARVICHTGNALVICHRS